MESTLIIALIYTVDNRSHDIVYLYHAKDIALLYLKKSI